jgi:hypothetical protein
MDADRWFERLAAATDVEALETVRAPARLKSRLYSALITELSTRGRLSSLTAIKEDGRKLCIFEEMVARLPVSERVKEKNPCRICHARVLGERMEHAPIFWPGCPYSDFHKG